MISDVELDSLGDNKGTKNRAMEAEDQIKKKMSITRGFSICKCKRLYKLVQF